MIAIEQRGGGLNPRSTVATEIYDYLRVLWAAAGIPHDPEIRLDTSFLR